MTANDFNELVELRLQITEQTKRRVKAEQGLVELETRMMVLIDDKEQLLDTLQEVKERAEDAEKIYNHSYQLFSLVRRVNLLSLKTLSSRFKNGVNDHL